MNARRAAVIVLGALVAIALAGTLALARARGQDRELGPRISADIDDAQAIVVSHGGAMRDQAEALIAAAERSAASDRAHWLADGRTMLTYADRLDGVAARLADQAKLLGGHSTWWTTPGARGLAPAGRSLRDEGRALSAHAEAMAGHARAMEAVTSEGAITAQDIALLRDAAGRMRDAAARVVRLGESLERYGDAFTRSLALR